MFDGIKKVWLISFQKLDETGFNCKKTIRKTSKGKALNSMRILVEAKKKRRDFTVHLPNVIFIISSDV